MEGLSCSGLQAPYRPGSARRHSTFWPDASAARGARLVRAQFQRQPQARLDAFNAPDCSRQGVIRELAARLDTFQGELTANARAAGNLPSQLTHSFQRNPTNRAAKAESRVWKWLSTTDGARSMRFDFIHFRRTIPWA